MKQTNKPTHPSIHPSTHPPITRPPIHQPTNPPTHPSINPPTHPSSIHPPIHPSTNPPTHPSIHPPTHLSSIHPFIHPSIPPERLRLFFHLRAFVLPIRANVTAPQQQERSISQRASTRHDVGDDQATSKHVLVIGHLMLITRAKRAVKWSFRVYMFITVYVSH